jgi:hypothetical protein
MMETCRYCARPIGRTTLPPDAPGGWTRGPNDPAGHHHEPAPCAEPLADRDGYRARCTVARYTEHSHHDHTARAAVAAGLAAR